VVEQDPHDANYVPLQENYALLKSMKDLNSRPFRIETLPCPRDLFR